MPEPVEVIIGIRVFEEPQRLHATLQALAAHTAVPHRLLLLGDGPDAETSAALSTLADIEQSSTTEHLGGASCFNRLTMYPAARAYVLLESGARPGPDWLDRLLATMMRTPGCGIAGPSTNRSSNQQCLFPGRGTEANEQPPDDIAMARLAARRFGHLARPLVPRLDLADFCYVVSRETVDGVGPADESYGPGPCWEMDYNIRAYRAGITALWVCAAWVGRAPVGKREAEDHAILGVRNRQRYADTFCLKVAHKATSYPSPVVSPRMPLQQLRPLPLPDLSLPAPQKFPREPRRYTPIEGSPLASCIMPTAERRAFVPRAIAHFLAQDYAPRELIVIDDGTDSIRDLIPNDERIRYVRLSAKSTIGAKRNHACRLAAGPYILHWDDDDWYPSDRIRRQVAALQLPDVEACGSSELYYFEPKTEMAYRYHYRGGDSPVWFGGLAYLRSAWERHPFDDLQMGEDVRFLGHIAPAHRHDLHDPALIVATLHPGNTSPKHLNNPCWLREDAQRLTAWMAEHERRMLTPHVRCIMPTRNRRAFIPLALACFQTQEWPNKELVIVDDGEQAVEDLVARVENVRYLRLDCRHSIGEKRNLACAHSSGSYIVHWDDDDWHAPNRISRQVEPLMNGAHDLSGLNMQFLLEVQAGAFWQISGQLHGRMFVGDVLGGTLTFARKVWLDGARYPDTNLAEDAGLIRNAQAMGKQLLRLENGGEYIYMRHPGNTWQFEPGGFIDPGGWRRGEAPAGFSPALLQRYRAASRQVALAG
ncbi:glycosyltransferase [Granulicella tundricola]|uniref:Glycosyl transferase family 2 n=1 Tax=Granulicella tundricola (strain ATCC BAA-1859 / DSM 23138 / MP5ACTX9) TaxID=1198114 RepID=E8X5D2_GRATM|nr:glycosyltransferase [Granulicella tundricola]ADW69479.1 glycosyl transferase family 2 [Granulicella tundricola MP5ACTX9]